MARGASLPSGAYVAGPNEAKGAESSGNWAGYGVSGGTFTKVAGSWVQPKSTCPAKPNEGAAFWVGIDGLATTDSTVEQIGTDSDCIAGTGPTYYAWYQMYPTKKEVNLPQATYPVVPGETIAAQVSAATKTTFTLTISATSGGVLKWHFSTKQTLAKAAKVSSVEWIAEAPCVKTKTSCQTLPLANFGTVNFSGLSVVGKASKTGFTDTEITMKDPKTSTVKARPSALSPSKTAFSVTWLHV